MQINGNRVLSLLGVLVILAGCGAAGAGQDSGSSDFRTPTTESPSAPAPQKQVDLPRKIIYTGQVALICEDLDKAADLLEARVKQFSGYIGNANRTGSRGTTREGSWTIRMPSGSFVAFLKTLPTLGELESSSQTADDVSEEFYDVQARLRNKKIEESRLIELLKEATGRLSEILTVEKELTRVREEIERIEGRLRYLSNQTELSTVTVTLREVKGFVPEGPPSVDTRIGRAFGGSLDALKEFGIAVLLFIVALLPWIVPLGLLGLVARAVLNRHHRLKPPVV